MHVDCKSLIGQLLIEIPMVNPRCLVDDLCNSNEPNEIEHENPWHWWNTFRSTADFSCKLSVALELSADIPSKLEISRWQGRHNSSFEVNILNV